MTAKFPAINQVDAYWEGLRKGRLMPNRAEIDPRGLESALEYAMMLELVAPGVARIRVAGMHMSDLLGMEVRGMPISAFFEPGHRKELADVLDQVIKGPRVAELSLESAAGVGRPALDARLLLAPVASEGRGQPRLLACLQSTGGTGRPPRRFTITNVHRRRIVASAGAASFNEESQPAARSKELAEEAGIFEPAPLTKAAQHSEKTAAKRAHLRLVKG